MTLNIEPKEVFHWFSELNKIPRCSGNEKEVSDFLKKFAEDRNLEVIQDEALNVIIKKKGSEGYENSKPVIIQGHMDMVCVKEEDSDHDFEKDPITMKVEGDFLTAEKTTLGGDDGIAVAYGLAVLDGDYKHPPLEVLITTSEETTMEGAAAIKEGMLSGKYLLNIDSEEEGIFLVSCAGGSTIETKFEIKREKEKFDGEELEITVSGLLGGHSGMEIIKQRQNANVVLFRILNQLQKVTDLRLSEVSGGVKHNAIPSNAKAKLVVKDFEKAKAKIEEMTALLKSESEITDPDLTIEVIETTVEYTFTKPLTEEIIDYMTLVPDGVISMSQSIEGLVQTSLNNAVIYESEGNLIVETSIRSSSESEMDKVYETLKTAAKRTKAKIEQSNKYPAWEFEQNSPLRDLSLKVYEELFGKEATYDAVHAGLECGMFKKVLKDTDMISFGPNMFDVHTPKERISIESTERTWRFILKMLEELK